MTPQEFLTREDLRHAAGHRVLCGFAGTTVDAELKEVLREVRPIGVILFARNIESPEAAAELIRELKSLPERKDDPLLVSVDQEGGRVARLRSPVTEWPPMRELGALGDPTLIERVGHGLGAELRALGFDVDYAPVLDVDTNPANPVIGDRAFSDNAERTGDFAAAFLRGLNRAGVGGCGKHFPGHGDTDVDSHLALPRVEHELPLIREREWEPYRRAIAAGLDAVMTAHVVLAAIDETVPATLSPDAMRMLREELDFRGVILSDDVEMKALADHFSTEEIVARGIESGLDVFLTCKEYSVTMDTYRALVQRFEQGAISHEQIQQQHKRVTAWRDRWTRGPSKPELTAIGLGGPLAEEVAQRLAAG
ncbi:MAG: beta-N-acetylhexosaminidase [Myxococcota bacterium]